MVFHQLLSWHHFWAKSTPETGLLETIGVWEL
ncbi:hypothetical protein [Pontibacter actiniarum]